MSKFNATKQPIGHGHNVIPDEFLQTVLDAVKMEPDALFNQNPGYDIYSILKPRFGSVLSALMRRALMAETLRVVGGDESDFDFKEGADKTAGFEHPDEMEAGAFQVSYNSWRLGKDLQIFLAQNGVTDATTFQAKMKADPIFDCCYTMRLLRQPYKRWDGPINQGWVLAQVNSAAVSEWEQLLSA